MSGSVQRIPPLLPPGESAEEVKAVTIEAKILSPKDSWFSITLCPFQFLLLSNFIHRWCKRSQQHLVGCKSQLSASVHGSLRGEISSVPLAGSVGLQHLRNALMTSYQNVCSRQWRRVIIIWGTQVGECARNCGGQEFPLYSSVGLQCTITSDTGPGLKTYLAVPV